MAQMKIDKRLNIVLEVEQPDDKPSTFVHSMPITRAVYDQHFLLLAKTVSRMYAEGIGAGTCARIALNMLRKLAKDMDAEQSSAASQSVAVQNEVEKLLLPAIWQRTNVLMPGDKGWEHVPFQEVIDRQLLDDDDAAEVQNYLVFFTAASWVHMFSEVEHTLYPLWKASGAQITSLNCTAFANSLPTLKKADATGPSPTEIQ